MSSRNSPNEYPQQCPWTMRIGVFFDGTGNNKENDFPKGKASNIAKLYEKYKRDVNVKGETSYGKHYENGVGTIDGVDEDDYESSGMALGEGGIERVHSALKEVANFFNKKPCAKEFIVDVFGFSRGAAQARHFVNEIHDRAAGPNVKVGFVGLFDTVGSFVDGWLGAAGFKEDKAGDNINRAEWYVESGTRKRAVNPYLGITVEEPYYKKIIQDFNFNLSAASADYIEHFTANDEIRENFPLSSVKPTGGGFINEKGFIGVHSDIGGGYSNESEDTDIKNYLTKISRTQMVSRYSYRTIKLIEDEELATIKENYIKQGYTLSERTRGYDKWLYGTKKVSKELANVYLHLMHLKAITCGVPIDNLPDDAEHKIPEDLSDYGLAILHNQPLTNINKQHIYSNYVHQSDIDPEDRVAMYKLFSYFEEKAHAPEENGIRTVFDNEPHKAVDPEANDRQDTYGAEINLENLSG